MCILEYPGGAAAYFGYKETIEVLNQGLDIKQASKVLSVNPQAVRRRLNKGEKIANAKCVAKGN